MPQPNQRGSSQRTALTRVKGLRVVVGVLALLSVGCDVGPARIRGESMAPTLENGERADATRKFDRLERGDIVLFRYPRDETKSFVLRIVGLPGEQIEMDGGAVLIGGRLLDESYVAESHRSAESWGKISLADDEYFVMGDNRRNASDSRVWGPVRRELIWARVGDRSPLPESLLWLALSGLLLVLPMRQLWRKGDSLWSLMGSPLDRAATRWAVTAGVALLGVSTASTFAVFLPLSYAAPGLAEWLLIENQPPFLSVRGDWHVLANIVNLLVVTCVGPFAEEVFFRGFLLPAWARRLGSTWALIGTSLLFAVLHADIVGGFIFGVVTAVVFLETRRLWLPIAIHVTSNTLVSVFAIGEFVFFGESVKTLADFQGMWWIGIAGFSVGLPLLIGVLRRIPAASAPMRTRA